MYTSYQNWTSNDPFKNISSNLIAYILQFFELGEIINFSNLNSKFHKAFKSDLIWETQLLSDELFDSVEERRKFSSWREYYFSLRKLRRNLQGGRSNVNFRMRPARGHKNIITAIVFYEDETDNAAFPISGDEAGVVLKWSLDEEGDYQSKELLKTEGGIRNIILHRLDSQFIIIVDDKSNLYVLEKLNLLHKFNLNVQEMNIAVSDGKIFACSDLHKFHNVKNSPQVHCWSLKKGIKEKEYNPSYSYSTFLKLSEEVKEIKDKLSLRNYFNNDTQKLNSLLVNTNKVYLISNYDLEEGYLVSMYNSNRPANLFVFDVKDQNNQIQIHLELVYLFQVDYIRNHLVVLGLDCDGWTRINFYSQSKFELKLSYKIQKTLMTRNRFFEGILDLTIKDLQLNCSNDQLVLIVGNKELINFHLQADKINANTFKIDIDNKSEKQINCVSYDKFKFAIAYNDNTIKVYSSKTKELWHTLLCGSLSVVPKSFIAHPKIIGFNQLLLTKYSIIGVTGNLIREYVYIN